MIVIQEAQCLKFQLGRLCGLAKLKWPRLKGRKGRAQQQKLLFWLVGGSSVSEHKKCHVSLTWADFSNIFCNPKMRPLWTTQREEQAQISCHLKLTSVASVIFLQFTDSRCQKISESPHFGLRQQRRIQRNKFCPTFSCCVGCCSSEATSP